MDTTPLTVPSYEVINSGTPNARYICLACDRSRTMSYEWYTTHCTTDAHISSQRAWVTQQRAIQRATVEMSMLVGPGNDVAMDESNNVDDVAMDESDELEGLGDLPGLQASTDGGLSHSDDYARRVLEDLWAHDFSNMFKSPNNSQHTSEHGEGSILDERENENEIVSDDDEDLVPEENEPVNEADAKQWYPFANQKELIAMLLLGTTRDILSRNQYNRVRALVLMLGIRLPEHSVLCKRRKTLKERLGFNIWEYMSPLGSPCFGLNIQDIISHELSNPLVSQNLLFYPELNTAGPINRLSQSRKWLSGFPPERRVPMVEMPAGQHWYLYEPMQSRHSPTIYVPVFFYTVDGVLHAKCLRAKTTFSKDTQRFHISLPAEPDFNSPELKEMPVSDFSTPWDQILIKPGKLMKDHCGQMMHQSVVNRDDGVKEIPCVNPWRIRAQQRVIRHFPIMLYSDDSSGNKSNKWNKHMSFYFTAAGLPPKLANQEYNIHFISTSNVAGAPEMGIKIVNDLNHLGDEGFIAYDSQLKKEVLVIPVVLAYLGDSPMHAEISNTMLPANALTPCRMCHLQVGKKIEKVTVKYVSNFVGVDAQGRETRLPVRDWNETIKNTKHLWTVAGTSQILSEFDIQSRRLGIKDTLNGHFVQQVMKFRKDRTHSPSDVAAFVKSIESLHGENIFNPFLRLKGWNGHQDTPVEVLHVVLLGVAEYIFADAMRDIKDSQKSELFARWQSFDCAGLNIPPIIPKTMIQHCGSLVGKEIKVVLQAAPFVLFPFIPPEKKDMWTALCHLAPRIFQTEIPNMDVYLADLKTWVNRFLKETMKVTAQWTNKPKFHMLLHLVDSIENLGPAVLFETEPQESYNGNMRTHSIHSNRQSPGQDIANSYNNYKLVRHVSSGARFFDSRFNTYMTAGVGVIKLLEEPTVQKMFGYNVKWATHEPIKIKKARRSNVSHIPSDIPEFLIDASPTTVWTHIGALSLESRQVVQQGTFVAVKQCGEVSPFIACVKALWFPNGQEPKDSHVLVNKCVTGVRNTFYGMRTLRKLEEERWIQAQDIEDVINVQHNCHDGRCKATKTRSIHVERRQSTALGYEMDHSNQTEYVINSAAFHSPELHRRWGTMVPADISPAEWVAAISAGVKNWEERNENLKKKK